MADPMQTTWVSATKKPETSESSLARLSSWPATPSPLKRHTWITSLFLVGDVILILFPIYFILLAIAAAKLNGKPVDGNSFASKVQAAIQLGPTLFPIMFAAISGRSLKMIARYSAERGTRLSTLELLMASQSTWGAVESQILMRRLTVVGVNLLFLWALSPIGGQASLRLLDTSTATTYATSPFRYLSTGPGSAVWAMSNGAYVQTDGSLTQVQALYASALFSSNKVKQGPEDTWSNVKIPYWDDSNQTQSKSGDWVNVTASSRRPEDYSSLVGIPVIGLPLNQDSSFSLEITQLTLDCEPFVKAPISNLSDPQELLRVVPGQVPMDESPWGDSMGGVKWSSFFLQTDIQLTNGDGQQESGRFNTFTGFINSSMAGKTYPKRKITYASRYQTDPFLRIANCSLGQIHTETIINCTKDGCAAVRMRPSKSDQRDEQVTPFDHIVIAQQALSEFPKIFGWSQGSAPTEQFLFNSTSFQLSSPTTAAGTNSGWVDMSLVAPDVFARRLALLLNTYYQLTIAPNAYLGNLPQNNFSAFGPDTIPARDINVYLPHNMSAQKTPFADWYNSFDDATFDSGIYFIGATTNATVSQTHDIFASDFLWVGLLLAAATVVFLIGVVAFVLKRRTLAPEMFGFVASMTYENQFVKIPAGGSTFDAMERARLLRDVEVHIGDVHGDEDVGHIALAAGVPIRKLERGRLYL